MMLSCSNIKNLLSTKKLQNAVWMISEKIVSIFGVIFVTSFVAKYIGPDNFGKLTLAASVFAIVQTFSMFGLENVIFHKVSKNKRTGEKLIRATRAIRNIIFLILTITILIYIYLTMDRLFFVLSLATSISVYFALSDIYNIYFNAVLQSKINTICNVIGLIVALILRYFIADFELSVEYLSIPIVLTTFIPFIIKRTIYNKKVSSISLDNREAKVYIYYSISVGRKLILYSLAVAIFTKTSQLFLGWQSTYDLGLYAVLSTLGMSFGFIFNALISSFMVEIYSENDFNDSQKMVARLNLIIVLVGFFILLLSIFFGDFVIKILYGDSYISVSKLLPVMVVACILSGLSTISERYLIKFHAYDYLQKKTNILLVLNVGITFFLVKYFNLWGAVLAILLTELITATLLNYFYKGGVILDSHKRIFMFSTYKNR